MSLLQQGIEKGLIRFDEEKKEIVYIKQKFYCPGNNTAIELWLRRTLIQFKLYWAKCISKIKP